MPVRVLCLSDTHLGFDLPAKPRIRRRRRGHDFLVNYERALAPAFEGTVDLVVHAGDLFHRASVPHTLVYQAFEPLRRLGDAGIPVFVVPGNHERSRIPHSRFASHPGIHIFNAPRTVVVVAGRLRIAVSGFPYQRRDVRSSFRTLVEATRWRAHDADIAILCAHHCFEGATVGPANHTFAHASDVIRGVDIPPGLAAVLTGHVHRHQVLTADLCGRRLAAPVLYPGSIERTAFAEIGEPKGYILLELEAQGARSGGRVVRWTFEELPARPMIQHDVQADGLGRTTLERLVSLAIRSAPEDAVLRLRIRGRIRDDARPLLAAHGLRALAPPEMNLDVVVAGEAGLRGGRRAQRMASSRGASEPRQYLLEMDGA